MQFKTIALILLAGSANAAGVSYKLPTTLGNIAPIYMPAVSIIPMTLPTVNAELAIRTPAPSISVTVIPVASPAALPVLPAAAIGRERRLPSVPSPLPLPEQAILAETPAIDLDALLNFVPEAETAHNDLRDGAQGRDPIRSPGSLFDGRRREKLRDLELPSNKYF